MSFQMSDVSTQLQRALFIASNAKLLGLLIELYPLSPAECAEAIVQLARKQQTQ